MEKHRKQNEIILIRSEDIECRNFWYSAASLKEDESLLRLFKLVCQGPECEGLNCNHGCYKAVDKDCHQILDESDMFMLHLEFPTPLNYVCEKFIGESEIPPEIFTRNSSAKTIREDLHVNDVMVCDKSLREKILLRFKKYEEVQVYKYS